MMLGIDLAGRTALVTGASGGLGEHFARVLAKAGAGVVIAARRQGELDRIAATIRDEGGACETAILDRRGAGADPPHTAATIEAIR